jgi:hypothetical protein
VQSVSTDGGAVRTVIPFDGGAGPAWVTGKYLFTLRRDTRAIRRRALDGSTDEVLYEAPSGTGFIDLVVSPDGQVLSVNLMATARSDATRVCIDEASPGGKLDCDSAGLSTAGRSAFSADGRALYFSRDDDLVRFDVVTHAETAHSLTSRATTLAISRDGSRLVMSSCQVVHDVVRLDDTFAPSQVADAEGCAGSLSVGPMGALAFPVEKGWGTSLAVTDDEGAYARIVTPLGRTVTEATFSPGGRQLVFHYATAEGGGLFVTDVAGDRDAKRLRANGEDSSPLWVDATHVVFLRPERGLPYGRAHVVATMGGDPRKLPILPCVPFGAVSSRGVPLMVILAGDGARFVETTLEGKTHPLLLVGAPPAISPSSVSASPSGRYITMGHGGGRVARRLANARSDARRLLATAPRDRQRRRRRSRAHHLFGSPPRGAALRGAGGRFRRPFSRSSVPRREQGVVLAADPHVRRVEGVDGVELVVLSQPHDRARCVRPGGTTISGREQK